MLHQPSDHLLTEASSDSLFAGGGGGGAAASSSDRPSTAPTKAGRRSSSRQRQVQYELERHAFEANTLTQLFLILAKKEPSWWKTSGGSGGGPGAPGGSGGTGPDGQASPGGPAGAQQLGGGGEAVGQGGAGAAGAAGGLNTTAAGKPPLAGSPSTAGAAVPATGGSGGPSDAESPSRGGPRGDASSPMHPLGISDIVIPDTVVWENNIPKGWFYYDTKEMQVSRKKVETRQVQQAFLKEAMFENDIVATCYSIPSNTDTEAVEFQFITAAQLPVFLFESKRGKGTSILQRYVYSLGVNRNDMIQVVYSPVVTQLSRRQCVNDLFDERLTPDERCATFEGPTHQSSGIQCTKRLEQGVHSLCRVVADHFHATDAKHVLSRLVLYLKIAHNSKLILLFGSSARVLPKSQQDITRSTLLRKYRVAVEIATNFVPRSLHASSSHHHGGDAGGGAKASGAAGGAGKATGSAGFAGSTTNTRHASPLLAFASASPSPSRPPHSADPPHPQHLPGGRTQPKLLLVDNVDAKKHGFVMRTRGSVDDPSGGGGGVSGDMGSQHFSSSSNNGMMDSGGPSRRSSRSPSLSRRSSSFAGRMPVQTIFGEILAIEEDPMASEEAKKRGRQLLDSCVKKVGLTASRTAFLTCREEQLTEGEKCELLFLKYAELSKRRARKQSMIGLRGDTTSYPAQQQQALLGGGKSTPPPSPLWCGGGKAAGRGGAATSGGGPPPHEEHQRRALFEGVPATVGTDIEQHLADYVYGAQVYVEKLLGVPRDVARPMEILLSDAVVAERAFAQYLMTVVAPNAVPAVSALGGGCGRNPPPSLPSTANLQFTIEKMQVGGPSGTPPPSSSLDGAAADPPQPQQQQQQLLSGAGDAGAGAAAVGFHRVLVPLQDRMSQRLQHLVHSTLAAHSFLLFVQEGRRKLLPPPAIRSPKRAMFMDQHALAAAGPGGGGSGEFFSRISVQVSLAL